tara:strand:+ start:180 stop:479 length:300 start_codon:yes stop_codon:yes gene_type:complete
LKQISVAAIVVKIVVWKILCGILFKEVYWSEVDMEPQHWHDLQKSRRKNYEAVDSDLYRDHITPPERESTPPKKKREKNQKATSSTHRPVLLARDMVYS